MKILQVVPWLALRAGGTSVVVVGLSRALQDLGADVTIYTTDIAVPAQAYDLRGGVTFEELPAGSADLNIEIFNLRHPYRFVFSPALGRALSANAAEYDVIHIHSLFFYPQYVAWREARRADVPFVVSPHGALDPYLRRRSRVPKRLADLLWQRRMLDGAAAFHLTSHDEARLVADLCVRAPHCVVPIGIDTGLFERLPSAQSFRNRFLAGADVPVILNHGRITEKKGLDVLVPALKRVRSSYPSAVLVLVGPDDEGLANRIRADAYRLELGDAVIFTGPLAGDELMSALAATDVWALPSHSENFGLAMIEAMAAFRPVVTSPNVNIAAAAQSSDALIMVGTSPGAVAEAIVELLDQPDKRRQLGQSAHQFAKRYDWQETGKAFLNLYAAISKGDIVCAGDYPYAL